jgi:Anion-transporting ATPase
VTSTAERSRSPQTQLQLFGGKGGVGKTTCAAAWAITAARSGLHTLLISVDPAHSLGDVLGVRLGPAPRLVPATRGRLSGVEIRASSIVRRWLTERRDLLEAIALRGTWLDRDDVSGLLELTLPGIDELAALLEIARFSRSGRYELLVVDTAPTGHTLRLLGHPGRARRRGWRVRRDAVEAPRAGDGTARPLGRRRRRHTHRRSGSRQPGARGDAEGSRADARVLGDAAGTHGDRRNAGRPACADISVDSN